MYKRQVHGANTAKIRGYGMNENPEYGSLAKVPVYRLRQVLNPVSYTHLDVYKRQVLELWQS